jgi:acyl phosphate:glycerol-3-phosphate acyltransferase
LSETIKSVILTVAGYFIGSIPVAFLFVKWRYHQDIRRFGSGQVGSSNVFRNFSKAWGITIGIYDGLKGAMLVGIAYWLGLPTFYQVVIGLAVIAGHNWPLFLHFNAGRGLATTLGVCFVIYPFGIWIFLAFAAFTLVIKTSPLPSLAGMAAMPISAWIRHQPAAVTLGLTALLLVIILRRISAPLTERSRTISKSQLYINRLLFDRDIRDGKAWINYRGESKQKGK